MAEFVDDLDLNGKGERGTDFVDDLNLFEKPEPSLWDRTKSAFRSITVTPDNISQSEPHGPMTAAVKLIQGVRDQRSEPLLLTKDATGTAFVRTMSRVPENLLASGIKAVQGKSGASVVDQDLGDRLVSWVEERNKQLAQEYSNEGIISRRDVAELGPNLGFSGISMTAGIGGGIGGGLAGSFAPGPGNVVGSVSGSMAASGAAAYRMQTYSAMMDWLTKVNEESIKQTGKPITPAEEKKFKEHFDKLASESGLWEAGPEAVGNVLEIALMAGKGTLPGRLASLLPKGTAGKVVKGVARAAGIVGTEEATETITQHGQHNVEVKAGTSKEPLRKWTSGDDLLKSAGEVLPGVLLLSGFMTGGGAIYRKATGKNEGKKLSREKQFVDDLNISEEEVNPNATAEGEKPEGDIGEHSGTDRVGEAAGSGGSDITEPSGEVKEAPKVEPRRIIDDILKDLDEVLGQQEKIEQAKADGEPVPKAEEQAVNQKADDLKDELVDAIKERKAEIDEANNVPTGETDAKNNNTKPLSDIISENGPATPLEEAKSGESSQVVDEKSNKAPILPVELSKSNPRYSYREKQFQIEFPDDVTKAAYIVRNSKKLSAKDAGFMSFLRSQYPEKTDEQIRALGESIKSDLTTQAKTAKHNTTLKVNSIIQEKENVDPAGQSDKIETDEVDFYDRPDSKKILDEAGTEGHEAADIAASLREGEEIGDSEGAILSPREVEAKVEKLAEPATIPNVTTPKGTANIPAKDKPQAEAGFTKVFRGEYQGNKKGNYYSPDVEFARQFTQSGLDKEIIEGFIKNKDIYRPKEDVYAGDPDAVEGIVQEAKNNGFKAVELSEGDGQPKSIYVIDRSAVKSTKQYTELPSPSRPPEVGGQSVKSPISETNTTPPKPPEAVEVEAAGEVKAEVKDSEAVAKEIHHNLVEYKAELINKLARLNKEKAAAKSPRESTRVDRLITATESELDRFLRERTLPKDRIDLIKLRHGGKVEAAVEVKPEAKEPWQMTREEVMSSVGVNKIDFSKSAIEDSVKVGDKFEWVSGDSKRIAEILKVTEYQDGKMFKVKLSPVNNALPGTKAHKDKIIPSYTINDILKLGYHKTLVEKAVREGKPVPENVLADYPELRGNKKSSVEKSKRLPKETNGDILIEKKEGELDVNSDGILRGPEGEPVLAEPPGVPPDTKAEGGMGDVSVGKTGKTPGQSGKKGRSPARKPRTPGDTEGRDNGDSSGNSSSTASEQRTELTDSDVDRGPREEDKAGDEKSPPKKQLAPEDQNHRIAADDVIVPPGKISRAKANVRAINLLRELEAENRNPSPDEKKILAQFTGWGGLGEIAFRDEFTDYVGRYSSRYTPESFWKHTPKTADEFKKWKSEYGELLYEPLGGSMTAEEWSDARRSTLNAFYTSREVIRNGLWPLAERLGFKKGSMLEPSAGVGHILGLIPEKLSKNVRLMGIELDSMTGRILAKLYPEARVQITGFQDAKGLPDNSVDLVMSNFPFGDYSVNDNRHPDYSGWSIHNYFFARSIDAAKPGGLVIGITSHFTMDAVSGTKMREYLNARADFVGAIRLPKTAFEKNAGTEVVTDIIVLRKKSIQPFAEAQAFKNVVEISIGEGKAIVNEYFQNHPEMVLGEHSLEGSMYGENEYTVVPKGDLNEELEAAVKKFPENIMSDKSPEVKAAETLYAAQGDKSNTLVVRDGKPYFIDDNGTLVVPEWVKKNEKQVKAYVDLKNAFQQQIHFELDENSDETAIEANRELLNDQYDKYVQKYGHLNERKSGFLSEDDEYFGTLALEDVKKVVVEKPVLSGKNKGHIRQGYENQYSKAEIFSKRTVFPFTEPTEAAGVEDALNISITYRHGIDIDYVSNLLRITPEEAASQIIEGGLGFKNPKTGLIESKSKYLSGFVKEKLIDAELAAADDPAFEKNVTALKEVQPPYLGIDKIYVRLGSTWVPPKVIERFLSKVMGVSADVTYSMAAGEGRWSIKIRGGQYNALNIDTWGSKGAPGHDMVNDCLNLKRTLVYDRDADNKPFVNKEKSAKAQQQQAKIQEEFKAFVKREESITSEIEKIYNEVANISVERKYDIPKLKHYPGASHAIELREHQKRGVARSLEDSTFFAHGVGTGKTFLYLTIAMEKKRIGAANKSLIVVQGSTLSSYAAATKQLYPTAKVLIPNDKQRDAKNRNRLMTRIATNDWDIIVVPHEFYDMLPVNPDYEAGFVREQLEEIMALMRDEARKNGKKSRRVKDLEKIKEKKKARLAELAASKKDNAIYFDQLGIDCLLVDEAHRYKRNEFFTKMQNVKGIDHGVAKRSFNMMMKCRFIQDKTGGKNIFFATGTPISNTTAELWTMVRYVRPDLLKRFHVEDFDSFATTFGDVRLDLELTPTGDYKDVERFNRYVNGPELLQMWKTAADVMLSEDLNIPGIPKLKGGAAQDVTVERTDDIADYIKYLRGWRLWWEHLDGLEKKRNSHVPLSIFLRAKQAAIDMRLINPDLPDNPGSKLNRAADEVFQRWEATKYQRAAQVVFCDMVESSDGRFNLYRELKRKLVEKGIPEEEIAVRRDYKESQLETLFSKVNSGDIRVIIGGTEQLGVGVNMQERLYALHNIDAPPRPMDMEQRRGRIQRQGNIFPEVEQLNYGVKNTLDATIYQRLQQKQRFQNQVLRGDIQDRSFDDPSDDVQLSFEEMMAAFSGNPLLRERYGLENEIRKLQIAQDAHADKHSKSRQEIRYLKGDSRYGSIKGAKDALAAATKLGAQIEEMFPDGKISSISFGKTEFKEDFSKHISERLDEFQAKSYEYYKSLEPINNAYNITDHPALHIKINDLDVKIKPEPSWEIFELGNNAKTYRPTDMAFSYDLKFSGVVIQGSSIRSGQGFLTSVKSKLEYIKGERIKEHEGVLKQREKDLQTHEEILQKPFDGATKLRESVDRLAEVKKALENAHDLDSSTEDDAIRFFLENRGKYHIPTAKETEKSEAVIKSDSDKYFIHTSDDGFKEVKGTPVDIMPGFTFFAWKAGVNNWVVTERSTGLRVIDGETKTVAVEKARELARGKETVMKETIQRSINDGKTSPWYNDVNKKPEEPSPDDSTPPDTTLYSGLDPTQIVSALKGLKNNIQEATPYLEALGQKVYEGGKKNFHEWRDKIKVILGNLWEKFKEVVKVIWNKLKEERGSWSNIETLTENQKEARKRIERNLSIMREESAKSHKYYVQKARKEGKEIPEAVLKDYPELKKETNKNTENKGTALYYPGGLGEEESTFKLEEAEGNVPTTQTSKIINDKGRVAEVAATISKTIGREIAPENLRLYERNKLDDLGKLGRAFQKTIVVFQAEGEDLSDLPAFFDPSSPRTIYLNAETGDPHLIILGHELLHALRHDAPDIYDGFISHIEATDFYIERKAQYEKVYGRKLTTDETTEEYVADFVGLQFAKQEFWDDLASRKPGIFKKIHDSFIRLLNKIKGIVLKTNKFFKDIKKAERAAAKSMADYAERQKHEISMSNRGDIHGENRSDVHTSKTPENIPDRRFTDLHDKKPDVLPSGFTKRSSINISGTKTEGVGKLGAIPISEEAKKRIDRNLKILGMEAQKSGTSLVDYMRGIGVSEGQISRLMEYAKSQPVEAPEGYREVFPDEVLSAGSEVKMDFVSGKSFVKVKDTTGVKHAVVEEERVKSGKEPVKKQEPRGNEGMFQAAKAAVDSGEINPRLLAQEVAKKPRPITTEEEFALMYDRMRIKNELRDIQRQIDTAQQDKNSQMEADLLERRTAIESDLDTNDQATTHGGSEVGRSLQARTRMINEDYSLEEILLRARQDNGGTLSEEMRKKYEALAREIEEANEKIKAYEEKIASLEAKRSFQRMKNDDVIIRHLGQAKEKRASAKKALDDEFSQLTKQLNAALGGIHMNFDPTAVKILALMAKNRIKAGILTPDGIVDEIYNQIHEAYPEIDKRDIRDAISGYGKTYQLSKNEIEVQLREVKRLMRLISSYEDAMAGQVPLRSGMQRDKMSDQARELRRRVRQAMREAGIDQESGASPEEQWKTSLDAVKTRLRNQIHDLTKQIETGEKTPKKIGIKYDEEAEALREQRDKLKDTLIAIEGKPEMSPEQKIKIAMAAVEKSIAEYERRISEKDLAPKKKGSAAPETDELKALREKRDELKDIYKEMQKEAKPKKTPEEIALQSYKTRMKNRIKELEEKLEKKDFAEKPKRELRLDDEGLTLKHNLDRAIYKYKEARLKDQLARRSWLQKFGGGIAETANFMRSLKASMDVSAVFRQGLFTVVSHPVVGAKALPAMFKAFKNDKYRFAVEQDILNRPNYKLYKDSGLELTDIGTDLSKMEETFMSRLAEKIPGVAGSQRAYTTFLNKIRVDTFDLLIKNLVKSEGKHTPEEAKAIATLINESTGRGKVGMKPNTLSGLNTIFFAPRLVASRFQILAGHSMWKGTKASRKLIAKEYGRFLAGMSVVYLLAQLAGSDIEWDPRSSDFGKIKIGNTRIDPLGGFSQVIVFLSRVISGKTKSSSGVIKPIRGDVQYGQGNTADVIWRFLRTKLAPAVSASIDALTGTDVVGNKVTVFNPDELKAPETVTDIPKQIGKVSSLPEKTVAPMAIVDAYEAMRDRGIPQGLAIGALGMLGVGIQTYEKDTKQKLKDDLRDAIKSEDQEAIDTAKEAISDASDNELITERDKKRILKDAKDDAFVSAAKKMPLPALAEMIKEDATDDQKEALHDIFKKKIDRARQERRIDSETQDRYYEILEEMR